MNIQHEKILKLNDLQKAKELGASFSDLEIHFDESNEYFKFLRVKFDIFLSNVDKFYRVVAIVYGPYHLYCRLMLTDDIEKEQVSLFVIQSFFEYLRFPKNSNILALIKNEYKLCLKEQDELSLINMTTVPSIPLFVSPSCFISSDNVQLPKQTISKKQKRKLRALKGRVALLTEEIQKQKEENQNIVSQNEEWRKQKTMEYEVVKQNGIDLVNRFNLSNQNVKSLEKELEEVRRSNQNLKSLGKELEEVKRSNQNVKSLEKKLAEVECSNQKVRLLEKELEEAKRSNISFKELCDSQKKEIEGKTAEYDNLNRFHQAELKVTKVLSNVEVELRKTKNELEEQKKTYDNSNRNVSLLEKELDGLKHSNSSVKQLSDTLKKELDEKNIELDNLTVQYDNLNSLYQSELKITKELDGVKLELQKTKNELYEQKKSHDHFKAMATKQWQESNAGLEAYRQLIERKEIQLNAFHKISKTAADEEYKKQKSLDQELKMTREKCTNITNQLQTVILDCNKLRFVNTELMRRLNDMNAQIIFLSQPKPLPNTEPLFDSEIPLNDSVIWNGNNLFSDEQI